jgi:hypothetical protein
VPNRAQKSLEFILVFLLCSLSYISWARGSLHLQPVFFYSCALENFEWENWVCQLKGERKGRDTNRAYLRKSRRPFPEVYGKSDFSHTLI